MTAISSATSATVNDASNARLGTVKSAAAISMMKESLNSQASSTAELLESVEQPKLASSGTLGTQVNTYA